MHDHISCRNSNLMSWRNGFYQAVMQFCMEISAIQRLDNDSGELLGGLWRKYSRDISRGTDKTASRRTNERRQDHATRTNGPEQKAGNGSAGSTYFTRDSEIVADAFYIPSSC